MTAITVVELVFDLLKGVAWPLTVLAILWWLKNDISQILRSVGSMKVKSAGLELTLDRMTESRQIAQSKRKDLTNLSPTQIWFMDNVRDARISIVDEMKPAQKVMTRDLHDMGLIQIETDDNERRIVLTQLGTDFLDTASRVLN